MTNTNGNKLSIRIGMYCLLILFSYSFSSEKSDSIFLEIKSAYSLAKKHYAKKEVYRAYSVLEEHFGRIYDFESLVGEKNVKQLIPILNDYAFFAYRTIELNAMQRCADTTELHDSDAYYDDWSNRRFLTSTYDDAKTALDFVITKDSTRTVAYLNMADVIFDTKGSEAAEPFYKKYVSLMVASKKKSKIPPRALNPKLRGKLPGC